MWFPGWTLFKEALSGTRFILGQFFGLPALGVRKKSAVDGRTGFVKFNTTANYFTKLKLINSYLPYPPQHHRSIKYRYPQTQYTNNPPHPSFSTNVAIAPLKIQTPPVPLHLFSPTPFLPSPPSPPLFSLPTAPIPPWKNQMT